MRGSSRRRSPSPAPGPGSSATPCRPGSSRRSAASCAWRPCRRLPGTGSSRADSERDRPSTSSASAGDRLRLLGFEVDPDRLVGQLGAGPGRSSGTAAAARRSWPGCDPSPPSAGPSASRSACVIIRRFAAASASLVTTAASSSWLTSSGEMASPGVDLAVLVEIDAPLAAVRPEPAVLVDLAVRVRVDLAIDFFAVPVVGEHVHAAGAGRVVELAEDAPLGVLDDPGRRLACRWRALRPSPVRWCSAAISALVGSRDLDARLGRLVLTRICAAVTRRAMPACASPAEEGEGGQQPEPEAELAPSLVSLSADAPRLGAVS